MIKSLFKMMVLIATLAIHSCTNDDMMQDIATNAPLKFEIGDYPAYEDGARIIGTPDVGKTDWVDGDIVLVKVISETSTETFTLTYGNKTWTAGKQVSATGTPTIEVIYAPECQWGTDGNIQLKSEQSPYGTFEYMVGDCNLSGSTVSVNFYGKRTYSRLRLVPSNISGSIDVTTTGFTPAGPASTEVPAKYTLQTDSKGNAYLYGTFASDAVVTVKKDNVLLKEYKFSSASTIGKSYAMEVADTTPYVTFTAEAQQTLTMSKAVETLEYSVNGGEWETLGTTTVTFGGDKGNLRLRGMNQLGTGTFSEVSNTFSQIVFGNNVYVNCIGDIRTLIDYINYSTTSTENAAFYALFADCICLLSAPQLPSTSLAEGCYEFMFSGCTNLNKAPDLPATTLSKGCYANMFINCTNLTDAPKILAKVVGPSSCASMFEGCVSLINAPDLPATTLATGCYNRMFMGCTNLVKLPSILPAKTLATFCYQLMFANCVNIEEAPILPAETLVGYCYTGMFSGCSKLNKIVMLWAEPSQYNEINLLNCLKSWVWGVNTIGTFIKNPNMPIPYFETGGNGIPSDWTVIDYEEE